MAKQPGRVDASQDLHFPKAGMDRSLGFGKQPAREIIGGEYARTTYLGVNVRAFEPKKLRDRGGARAGLTKWLPVRTPTSTSPWIIQGLHALVTNGIAPPGGSMPELSQSGRVVTLIAVSQGTVYVANAGDSVWTTPANNTGETPALNVTGYMQSAQNIQKMWFCDGINYAVYQPQTNTVEKWVATAGKLPVDSDNNTGRLITTWRGRTVISGLLKDPQNWFMSRVTTPTDFDYAPLSTAPDQAVAGNNSPLGLIGDVVTALIPYNDDVLIFGGDHTVYMMRGDPMSGGQIDLVSDSIGIAWGRAWCKDPYGNVYFCSNRTGVYRMVPGQQPVRISQGIEQLLQGIDTGNVLITLAWNDEYQGFHMFITNAIMPSADTHYFYESRTGAWWQDKFGNNNLNPIAVVIFDGNTPGDRRLLIGSWDGYVRQVDQNALDDDGTPIASSVVIGPVMTPTGDEMLLHEIQGILAENSGQITWSVLVGNTAEAALASTAIATGTWNPSRNLTDIVRYSGHAVYLQLTSTVPWAMESIRARISTHGKTRRRGY